MQDYQNILPPVELFRQFPLSPERAQNIVWWRQDIASIIQRRSSRFLVIVWPCSIHDDRAAIEYAGYIQKWREMFSDSMEIVMRTYFEKPRTTVGWKGLINDPHLNGTYDIAFWIQNARKLLLELTDIGIPVATEFLDPISHLYFSDLVSWWAIWARTTESQTHRELASWLPCPVGFKNSTEWNIQVALDAILSSNESHTYLGVNESWNISIVTSEWNKNTHVILRWSNTGPNFTEEYVTKTSEWAKKHGVNDGIMIDVSHQNSCKDYRRQVEWIESIALQLQSWNSPIIGVMIESNILAGNQSFAPWITDASLLEYGKSITDACVNIVETEKFLMLLSDALRNRTV